METKSNLSEDEEKKLIFAENLVDFYVNHGIKVPDTSQRNSYTKACFLISILRRALKRADYEGIKENIDHVTEQLQVLKEFLPILQKKYLR